MELETKTGEQGRKMQTGTLSQIRRHWIAFCLTYAGVYEDYPFDDQWTAIRCRGNGKTFAFLYERQGRVWINLKSAPELSDFFRKVYPAVLPAYHMNKLHWNSVILDGTVPDEEIRGMISHSYELVAPQYTKRKNTP